MTTGEGDRAEQTKSHYAEMRRGTSEVTCAGPALGEIVSTGEIVDQTAVFLENFIPVGAAGMLQLVDCLRTEEVIFTVAAISIIAAAFQPAHQRTALRKCARMP